MYKIRSSNLIKNDANSKITMKSRERLTDVLLDQIRETYLNVKNLMTFGKEKTIAKK